jgi:uncharacterized repeat protein (TIGR01451 family)
VGRGLTRYLDPSTAVSAGATSLTITTTPSTTSIAANGTVTLTLKAQNTGSNVASNVASVDALPRQLAFVSASSGCAVNNGIVSCAIGTVNAGGMSSVQIVAQAGSTAGSVYNVAKVTSSTPNSASQLVFPL